jgi:serine phosphatase RsbU (regulator of sigma subunit)
VAGGEVIGAPDDAVLPAPRQRAAELADLAVAGHYVPAGPGAEPIAGDFFEVVVLADGLIALFVGDVSGHGKQAVDRMRALRATAKAYALEQPGPASLLARLDEYMGWQGPDDLATLWYGEYTPGSGMLTYASAGHPPPAVITHDGVPLLLDVTDTPPLGTGLAHAAAADHDVLLPPGAVLVAYSDGLIERRDRDFDSQLALLAEILGVACDPARVGTPASIAREILDALVPDPDRAEDDVCVLVVRRQP